MRIYYGIILIFLFIPLTMKSQTQAEMNQSACDAFSAADKELNQVYQKILKIYKEDTAFIKNIKSAQLQWIKLRDADLKAIFTTDVFYGTVEPMCRCGLLESFTKERLKFLKTWIEGIDDQEACKGTRMSKYQVIISK